MAAATHKADLVHGDVGPQHDVSVAAGHRIEVEIRSPDGPIWSGWAQSLKVPESLGLMGIMPRHASLLASLDTGLTTIAEVGGGTRRIITGVGFLEIDRNRVLMLVEFGDDPAKVDVQRAQASRDRAVTRLRSPSEEVDRVRAEAALARALVRLRFAGQPRL